jgi:GT2 family glycosyltransferase
MTHKKLPVIAAIPNYNMAKGLKRLLPQVLRQGYDHIYVLDDASTDNSEEVVASFGDKVTFVKSKKNGGGGAARNKLIPYLKSVSLIHFMDADVSLLSKNTPEIIQGLPIEDSTAFVSGLVLDKDGFQSVWNYGPDLSIISSIQSMILESTRKTELRRGIRLPPLYMLTSGRPNPHKTPTQRTIFWPVETNFVVRSDTFIKLGGFDEKIREHDIQPMALKAGEEHLKSFFSPAFIVQDHDDIDVRPYNRKIEMLRTEAYVIKRYASPLKWWLPFLKK